MNTTCAQFRIEIYYEEEIEEESYKSLEQEYIDSEEQPYSAEYETNDENQYQSYEEVYGKEKRLKTLDEQIQINEPVRKRFDEYKIKEELNRFRTEKREELFHGNILNKGNMFAGESTILKEKNIFSWGGTPKEKNMFFD